MNLGLLLIVTPRYFDDLQQVIVLFSYLKSRSILAAFILGRIIMAKDLFEFIDWNGDVATRVDCVPQRLNSLRNIYPKG